MAQLRVDVPQPKAESEAFKVDPAVFKRDAAESKVTRPVAKSFLPNSRRM